MLPPPFVKQMQALPGFNFLDFEAALKTSPPVSIRLNPAKTKGEVFSSMASPVPWHPMGRYLEVRPSFTLDPLFHAGNYYVQEAASMFLQEALRQCIDTSKPLRILDLCAAPGGKSTILADFLHHGREDAAGAGLLVTNEVIRPRVNILKDNIEKWGYSNVAVTCADPEVFGTLEDFFDVIVVDAPCSGEGMFRKDPDSIKEWSPANVDLCTARQRKILASVVNALAPGGLLIYSTCTYNTRENEDNVAWFAATFDLEMVPLAINDQWKITSSGLGYHFYPHLTVAEGFYLAVLKKEEGLRKKDQVPPRFKNITPLNKQRVEEAKRWVRQDRGELLLYETINGEVMAFPHAWEKEFLILDTALKSKWFGTQIGAFKGNDFIPDHGLALSLLASPDLQSIEVSLVNALLFLKKEVFPLPTNTPMGWTLVRYQGSPLGWIKVLPNRMNNYFPQERRIRMETR